MIQRPGLILAVGGLIALGSAPVTVATTEPDGLVDSARAGFDAYLAEVDVPGAGGEADQLDACPLLRPEQFDATIAALDYKGSFDQRMAVLGADAFKLDESDVEYRVLVCGAQVPLEVRSTPGVQVGAVRLPDGATFADVIAAEQQTMNEQDLPVVTGPTPAASAGR